MSAWPFVGTAARACLQEEALVSFTLPFDSEIRALDQELARLPAGSPGRVELQGRLERLEREVYPNLDAYEMFLLSGHPLRPKALDYVRYVFRDVKLFWNPKVHGDHLMIGGQGRIEIDGRAVDVMIVGQQTGPSSQAEHLTRLSASEYRDGTRDGVSGRLPQGCVLHGLSGAAGVAGGCVC